MSEFTPELSTWSLNQEAFDKLLSWLHQDRENAGELYESIRSRLMKFFEWQGCPYFEEHTDETIQRVIRKVAEGVEIHTTDPYSYFHGVARNVLREYWKSSDRKSESLDEVPLHQHPSTNPFETAQKHQDKLNREHEFECLEKCLSELPPESRELFLQYHTGEQRARIDNRQLMADRLGIPLNALRSRITRLNDKLEHCLRRCLKIVGKNM